MEIIEKLGNPDWWLEQCVTDLFFLCRNVLRILEETDADGYQDLYEPTHRRICDFVQKYAYEGQTVLVLTPRGWIKTYLITVGWNIQRQIKNWLTGVKEHTIINNATIKNAWEFLERIKHNYQYNKLLRGLLKGYIPFDLEKSADKWKQEEIQILGNKIETGSTEGNLVSQHYKIHIDDDLVNKENSMNSDQRLKILDWWKLARSLLRADGLEILIGTRWDYDDLYGYIIDTFLQPKRDYHLEAPIVEIHRGKYHLLQMDCWEDVTNETGSTFPVLYPEEKLKEIQLEQGDRFPGQYRNDPSAKGRIAFQRDWFQPKWRKEELPAQRYTAMLIDPSGKAQVSSDFTGVVLIHLGVDKKGYIEYGKRHLITDLKLAEFIIDKAIELSLDKLPDSIYIEDNKYHTIYDLLELLIPQKIRRGLIPKERLEYVKSLLGLLQPVYPRGRQKDVRIRHLTGWFESKRFRLPFYGAEELEDELLRSSARDDIKDALAYILDELIFPNPTDPPKILVVPEELKKTEMEREEEDWQQYKKDVFLGEPIEFLEE